MFLQLSAGIRDVAMLAIRVDLGEDGTQALGLFVITQAGINNEGIRPVAARVIHNWFRAKVSL